MLGFRGRVEAGAEAVSRLVEAPPREPECGVGKDEVKPAGGPTDGAGVALGAEHSRPATESREEVAVGIGKALDLALACASGGGGRRRLAAAVVTAAVGLYQGPEVQAAKAPVEPAEVAGGGAGSPQVVSRWAASPIWPTANMKTVSLSKWSGSAGRPKRDTPLGP